MCHKADDTLDKISELAINRLNGCKHDVDKLLYIRDEKQIKKKKSIIHATAN